MRVRFLKYMSVPKTVSCKCGSMEGEAREGTVKGRHVEGVPSRELQEEEVQAWQ